MDIVQLPERISLSPTAFLAIHAPILHFYSCVHLSPHNSLKYAKFKL